MTFDIALSGLNAASTELEVISHNIANNATTGFKSSRAEFADVYASSSANSTGQGVITQDIRQSHTAGNITTTGNTLDLAIAGDGFFQLDDNGSAVYTRNGTFSLDRDGYIVSNNGQQLVGYPADKSGELSSVVGGLRVDPSDIEPKATQTVGINLNLDATTEVVDAFDVDDPTTYNFTTAATIYDSLGTPETMTMYFHKDTPNAWSMFAYVNGVEISQTGGEELVFSESGQLDSVNGAPAGEFSLPTYTPQTGGEDITLTLDLTQSSQYNSTFGVNQIVQDGYTNGRLNSLSVDEFGIIFGQYTNGQTKTMGQVTLTNFTNPEGLQQVYGTSWRETYESGAALTGKPASGSLGDIRSGTLEESNVDITEELVAMISAQRSFQANAQVISTADTINQTVINMRR